MADLLGAGLDWLDRQRERLLTRPVRYRRGAQEVAVPATVGRTVFRLDTGPGVTERIEARDYLIAATHLAGFGLPLRGQRHLYEVLAPGREPHWRWSDPNRRCYRIHTKHLTTEDM